MNDDTLARIAAALERIAPPPAVAPDWLANTAYIWDGSARAVAAIEAPALELLCGIDQQKAAVVQNVARLAAGLPAHDMLLWGSRGMGKSALLRAAIADAQAKDGAIALVQVGTDAVATLPPLFAQLTGKQRNFLVFIDDLGFAQGDSTSSRHLRSWLDGGVEARPDNVRIAVTSNRRAILSRDAAEQDDPINPRDMVDDQLALADRFGLSLGFHAASQDDYLDMLRAYSAAFDLPLDEADALNWSKRRGARSGRVAWHYITELAGREGKSLSR